MLPCRSTTFIRDEPELIQLSEPMDVEAVVFGAAAAEGVKKNNGQAEAMDQCT
jgi:hypothetical protein